MNMQKTVNVKQLKLAQVKRTSINHVKLTFEDIADVDCRVNVLWSNIDYNGKVSNKYRLVQVLHENFQSESSKRLVRHIDYAIQAKWEHGVITDPVQANYYQQMLDLFNSEKAANYLTTCHICQVTPVDGGVNILIKDEESNLYSASVKHAATAEDPNLIESGTYYPDITVHAKLMAMAINYH